MRNIPLTLGLFCLSACQCGPTLVNDHGLSVSPSSLDFGQLAPGTSSTLTVQVQNLGTHQVSVSLTVVEPSREGAFALARPPTSIEPGAAVDVAVTYFAALAVSADVASLSVRDVDLDTDARVALLGRTNGAVDAGLDAGADAGLDAGFELPVFDGGGTCGSVNVLDLPLLPPPPVPSSSSGAAFLYRTRPSIVPVDGDFALAWGERLPDAGQAISFERLTPMVRAVVAPSVVSPAGLGGTETSEVRMAWNGKDFALTWDQERVFAGTDVNLEFLDGQGALRPVTPLLVPGLSRAFSTTQVPAWDARTQSWALAFGVEQNSTRTTSLRHLDGGSFAGPQTDYPMDFMAMTAFAAGLDGGFVLAGAQSPQALVLRRLDDAFAPVWSATLAQAFNGWGARVVVGATSYGVAWVASDAQSTSTGNAVWFAVVDASGMVHPPVKVRSDANEIDVAWNGATYTTVLNTYSDAGWQLEETRFDEAGRQQGAPRLVTCGTEDVFSPRIAWNSGEHLVTYEVNNGCRRVLLFP
jgi:hypothetical protein